MDDRKRIGIPDLLKGFAVILMIQVHLTELFAQQNIYDSLLGKLSLFLGGPPAAPIFMIVMGYFIARSGSTPLALASRALKLILWGFLLNIGINLHLFWKIYQGKIQLNPLEYLFGVDILFLAGLSILIILLLRFLFKAQFLFYFLTAILIFLVQPLLPLPVTGDSNLMYLNAYFWGGYRWSYFPVFPWVAYVLTGYSFYFFYNANLREKISDRINLIVLLFSGVASAILFPRLVNTSWNLQVYYHHNLMFFLSALIFLLFWTVVLNMIESELSQHSLLKYVKWLGKNVTKAYVFQWLIIGNLATALFKSQSLAEVIIWFVLILLSTSLMIFIGEKIKHSFHAAARN